MHEHSEICDCDVIHKDVVDSVRERMEDTETLYSVSDFFKVMSDSTRMRILYALDKAEMCVCDLSVLLNMTKSAISHQLKVLKDAELVKNRREGKNVFYSLKDDHVKAIIETGIEHIKEKE
ncbi:MAG: metalloregulator ArsR/SmtB family transcription factor [Clostridiales bacterium]|nr:metalloregulator ArsR/SmtB family transcription factor [Clostridiales bacterium]MCD7827281.1 metalloregulator ArsR/SmtB family transcription factor [Clostridiales bacterium]